jgi:uncharacterized protein YdhG (YjbR/CyaY superfamily)
MMTKPIDVDEYMAGFPKDVQKILELMRQTVKKAAPEAEEVISYGMPAFRQNGRLVYFAAHTKHLGFYPMTTAITAFKEELSDYKGAKGSVQFLFDQPLPVELITKMVQFRVTENLLKVNLKKK